jgi:hypothetical protein
VFGVSVARVTETPNASWEESRKFGKYRSAGSAVPFRKMLTRRSLRRGIEFMRGIHARCHKYEHFRGILGDEAAPIDCLEIRLGLVR